MTVNANPKLFNTSDSLVVRNVKRNVVGSGEQMRPLKRQTRATYGCMAADQSP